MRILILSFYLGRQFWWLKERSHAKGFAQWHVVLSNVSSYYCASTKMNPCSSAFSRFYLSGSSTVLRAQERGLDFKYHQSSVSVHPSWPEVTALLGCGSQFSVKDQTVNILGLGARRVFHHISSFASFFSSSSPLPSSSSSVDPILNSRATQKPPTGCGLLNLLI